MSDKLEITPELALSAARVVKEYCENREDCKSILGFNCPCPLYKEERCALYDAKLPESWEL